MVGKQYLVYVREVWVQTYIVADAKSDEHAIELVYDGYGVPIEGRLEYSHDLDTNVWSAEEATLEDIEEAEEEHFDED